MEANDLDTFLELPLINEDIKLSDDFHNLYHAAINAPRVGKERFISGENEDLKAKLVLTENSLNNALKKIGA